MTKYGMWCGQDAALLILKDMSVAFLRLEDEKIISVFKTIEEGVMGVVYGRGKNRNASSLCCVKNPWTGELFFSDESMEQTLSTHSRDSYKMQEDKMFYYLYDGTVFELEKAESIDPDIFDKEQPVDPKLSVKEKMMAWDVHQRYSYYDEGVLQVDVEMEKYAVCFLLHPKVNKIYCRVGIDGYCEKGKAMLSTVCIRENECRMLPDNRDMKKEFVPKEEFFVENGCAFPTDGGWYWSVKDATEDLIYLNGCAGDIYEIHRKKSY